MMIDFSDPQFGGNNYCKIDGYWWYNDPEQGWIKKDKVQNHGLVHTHRSRTRPKRTSL